jgi:hypothetical protein
MALQKAEEMAALLAERTARMSVVQMGGSLAAAKDAQMV